MRRARCLVYPLWIAAAGLAGCSAGPRRAPPPTRAKLNAEPRFAEIVASPLGPGGLVTLARPTRARFPAGESILVLLRFERANGPLTAADPLAQRPLRLAETARSVRLELSRPGGARTTHRVALIAPPPPAPPPVAAPPAPPQPDAEADVLEPADEAPATAAPSERRGLLYPISTLRLHLGRPTDAFFEHRTALVRFTPRPALALDRPGDLLLRVSGELVFVDGRIPFRSGAIPLRSVRPSPALLGWRPLCLRAMARLPRGVGGEGRPMIELPSGNLLCRFDEHGGEGSRYFEVELTPAGRVVDVQSDVSSYCVAAGTPIATPAGPRAVQRLRPGDRVWAYAPGQRRRQLVFVQANQRSVAPRLIALGGLRVTPEHPVWADGRWVRAGALRPGARLLRDDLGPRAVERATIIDKPAEVFALSVGSPHTYFAGGVLVHNKLVRLAPRHDTWYTWFERLSAVER